MYFVSNVYGLSLFFGKRQSLDVSLPYPSLASDWVLFWLQRTHASVLFMDPTFGTGDFNVVLSPGVQTLVSTLVLVRVKSFFLSQYHPAASVAVSSLALVLWLPYFCHA